MAQGLSDLNGLAVILLGLVQLAAGSIDFAQVGVIVGVYKRRATTYGNWPFYIIIVIISIY
jgi:hypothetical protein